MQQSPEPRAARLALPMAAVSLLAALAALVAALAPRFLPGHPAPSAEVRWFLSAAALSLAVAGFLFRRGATAYAVMAGLLVLGGAAQLFLTDPLWFPAPRLKPHGAVDAAMLALVAAEGLAAVAILMRRGVPAFWRGLRAGPGPGVVLLVIAAGGALGVSVMPYVAYGHWSDFAMRVGAGAVLTGVHLAAVAALASLPAPVDAEGGIHPAYGALVAVAACLILGHFAFRDMPHVEDELAYLYQARTFAAGALAAAPVPEAIRPGLDYYLMDYSAGRSIAVTAPGWPAALAVGAALGAPWIVNPLLAGLSVLFGYGVVRRLAGAATASILALLLAVSPWFIASGASLMTHALTTTLIVFAWWSLLKGREARDGIGTGWVLAAGLAMGWVFATRPLDGVIAGVLTGFWLLLSGKRALLRSAIYGFGCLAAGAGYFAYNLAMTGHLTTAPLDAYLVAHWGAGANAYGFGDKVGPPSGWGALDVFPGHSPLEALINTQNNFASLQLELMGWGLGSLAFALVAAVLVRPFTRFDRAMTLVLAATIAAMFPYWFAGSFYIGPRYWFVAGFPVLYLSARGVAALDARLARAGYPGRIGPVLWLLALFSLLVFTPWRGITKYHDYGAFHDSLSVEDARGTFGNAVVLVNDAGDPGSFLYLNLPNLPPDRPVYLTDTGTLDEAAIAAAFPDRKVVHFTSDWTAP